MINHARPLPDLIAPMLPAAHSAPFDSPDYVCEVKWDGIRCLAFIEQGQYRLQSRDGLDITRAFPELSKLDELPSGTVLDGELVVFEGNSPSLQKIMQRLQARSSIRIRQLQHLDPVVYMVFDILFWNGKSIMHRPLQDRRAHMELVLRPHVNARLKISQAIHGPGRDLFELVRRKGWEGIVAKRLGSTYRPGVRSNDWLKIKTRSRS